MRASDEARKSRKPSREELMDERAAADMASMDRTNSAPIDTNLLLPEPWMLRSGCGFSWNGLPVMAVRRVVRRRKQRK
jgi:hypothetical protein